MEFIPSDLFLREFKKLDKSIKEKLIKQIQKIIENPNIGKPLRYNLRGEKTVYVKPFRVIYKTEDNKITFLRFEHRDDVYG